MARKAKILIVLFFISFSLIGQESSEPILFEYIRPYNNFKIDTVIENLIFEKLDSNRVNLYYVYAQDSSKFMKKNEFVLSDNPKAQISLITLESQSFGDTLKYEYISNRNVQLNGKNYCIYKFYSDITTMLDDEQLIFFEPTIGIIMYRAISTVGYLKLSQSQDESMDIVVNKLVEFILADTDFYLKYKKKN